MYSPVSGSFGNIKKDPVIEIINRAADSTVLQLFVSKRLEEFHGNTLSPGRITVARLSILAKLQL